MSISRQHDAKRRGRPESGVRKAARELGVTEVEVRRAIKIASLSPEAQAVAVETGLDNNQSALLAAAEYSHPEDQKDVLRHWREKQHESSKVRQWNALVDAWNKAETAIQVEFLRQIDEFLHIQREKPCDP